MGVFCPPLIPFLSLIKSCVRRPGPDSESAQPYSESVSLSLGPPGVPSHGSESVSSRVESFAVRAMSFRPPECFSLLAVRHKAVGPQGHRQARATVPAPEAPRRTPRWAAWRCGFDSRGRPRVVHPRTHAGRLITEQIAVRLESLNNIRFMSYILHNI